MGVRAAAGVRQSPQRRSPRCDRSWPRPWRSMTRSSPCGVAVSSVLAPRRRHVCLSRVPPLRSAGLRRESWPTPSSRLRATSAARCGEPRSTCFVFLLYLQGLCGAVLSLSFAQRQALAAPPYSRALVVFLSVGLRAGLCSCAIYTLTVPHHRQPAHTRCIRPHASAALCRAFSLLVCLAAPGGEACCIVVISRASVLLSLHVDAPMTGSSPRLCSLARARVRHVMLAVCRVTLLVPWKGAGELSRFAG